MEREVSTITMLGVSMCMLAAFLSIVMVTVVVGNYIKASAYEEFNDVQIKMEYGTLKDLTNTDKEMSVSAVFGILQNSEDYIESVEYRIQDKNDITVTDLQNNLTGRTRLEVIQNKDLGTYKLILHDSECAWLYDPAGCTCVY